MTKYIVNSQDQVFIQASKCTLVNIPDKISWDNGDVWKAPYSRDELENIYEGVMFSDEGGETMKEIKIVTGINFIMREVS